jgi:CRISPR-associated protein Cas1
MSYSLLNTLYITTPGSYLRLEQDTVCVEIEGQTRLKVPLLHLGGIVSFGESLLSSPLLQHCMDSGISVSLHDRNGRFKARVEGATSGNVLLRLAQYQAPPETHIALARNCVAGKIRNARHILLRSARDTQDPAARPLLLEAAQTLARNLRTLAGVDEINELRGREGDAAKVYFGAFSQCIRADMRTDFRMNGRSRRPPLDRINALLSFLYAILAHDCRAALEAAGLDPQYGYLHLPRPGRISLALDLMEEFRPVLADRLALTLINRQQVQADDFMFRPGGAVEMSDKARKTLLTAWQERKKEEIIHPITQQKVAIGLLPYVQARLLARALRGDLPAYPPYIARG